MVLILVCFSKPEMTKGRFPGGGGPCIPLGVTEAALRFQLLIGELDGAGELGILTIFSVNRSRIHAFYGQGTPRHVAC